MTQFIENINEYIAHTKIKQTYISLKTGIDTKKLSRILTGVQEVNLADMEKIAKALGKRVEFFLQESMSLPQQEAHGERYAFYAGNPTEEQEEIAEKLVKFVENIDEVLSAKQRFLNMAKE